MIIKANKLLTRKLKLGTPRDAMTPLVLLPGQSMEVPDELAKSPVLQRAVARGEVTVMNFCGFVVGEGVAKITVATTPPESPRAGDIWVDIS